MRLVKLWWDVVWELLEENIMLISKFEDRSVGFGIMKSLTLDEFNFTFIKDFEAL